MSRWPDGLVKSQNNAFTMGYGGRVDVETMARNARTSTNATKTVNRFAKEGKPLGKISGLSKRADQRTTFNKTIKVPKK